MWTNVSKTGEKGPFYPHSPSRERHLCPFGSIRHAEVARFESGDIIYVLSAAERSAKTNRHSRIAQLAERLTVNQNVAGSSPAAGAVQAPDFGPGLFVFFLTLTSSYRTPCPAIPWLPFHVLASRHPCGCPRPRSALRRAGPPACAHGPRIRDGGAPGVCLGRPAVAVAWENVAAISRRIRSRSAARDGRRTACR